MIEELLASDALAAAALWESVGLTRPWNDPVADFIRAIEGATSTVLGHREDNVLVGTVMVGSDGHRGWVYYLAVSPTHQGSGLGTLLMTSAEAWLRERGTGKIQLMVRHSNEKVLAFYEHLDYENSEVSVLAKWISPSA
ncbi:MAG TPA: GNAT family acetyltransferase [Acidimicrobiales bacterium]